MLDPYDISITKSKFSEFSEFNKIANKSEIFNKLINIPLDNKSIQELNNLINVYYYYIGTKSNFFTEEQNKQLEDRIPIINTKIGNVGIIDLWNDIHVCILSKKKKYYNITQNDQLKDFLKALSYHFRYKFKPSDSNRSYSEKNCIIYNKSKSMFDKIEIVQTPVSDCNLVIYKVAQFYYLTDNNGDNIYMVRSGNDFNFNIDVKLTVVINKGFPFFMETLWKLWKP